MSFGMRLSRLEHDDDKNSMKSCPSCHVVECMPFIQWVFGVFLHRDYFSQVHTPLSQLYIGIPHPRQWFCNAAEDVGIDKLMNLLDQVVASSSIVILIRLSCSLNTFFSLDVYLLASHRV